MQSNSYLVGDFNVSCKKGNISYRVIVRHENDQVSFVKVERYPATGIYFGEYYYSGTIEALKKGLPGGRYPLPAYVKKAIIHKFKGCCTHVRVNGNCITNCGREFSKNLR